ncbi:MAG: hypothetical protein RI973_2007 [Bacteroidota bacterium]
MLFMAISACQSQQNKQKAAPAAKEAAKPVYEEISLEEFKVKMKEPGVVILDVRTPEETADGKVEGAMELNFYDEDFAQKLARLDRKKTYLVYCHAGGRSTEVCQQMQSQGFQRVYNFKGGYSNWRKK